jgi:sugar phosphate isomerase/epimerase
MIGDAGFKVLELWCEKPHSYPADFTPNSKRKLKKIIADYKMKVHLHAPFHDHNVASIYLPIEEAVARLLQDTVKLAGFLEAETLTIHPGVIYMHVNYQRYIPAAKQATVGLMRRLVQPARDYGVKIGFENMTAGLKQCWQIKLGTTEKELLEVVDNVDGLGVTLDPGHCHVNGQDAAKFAATLGRRIIHVHLSDNHGKQDEHLEPGEGTIDYASLTRTLSSNGYRGDMTLELEPPVQAEELEPIRKRMQQKFR